MAEVTRDRDLLGMLRGALEIPAAEAIGSLHNLMALPTALGGLVEPGMERIDPKGPGHRPSYEPRSRWEGFQHGFELGMSDLPGGETLDRWQQQSKARGLEAGYTPGEVALLSIGAPDVGDIGRLGGLAAGAPALFRTEGLEDVPRYGRQEALPQRIRKRTPKQQEQYDTYRAQAEARLPEIRERIKSSMAEGRAWYNTEPLREAAVDVLGESQGPLWHRGFAARMGPTSINSTMPMNTRRALWAQHASAADAPIGGLDPSQAGGHGKLGHRYYYGAMQPGLKRIEAAELAGADPLSALDPLGSGTFKTRRFGEGMVGNYQNVPPDLHMSRQFFDTDAPNAAQKAVIEDIHREILAPEFGLEPAQSMAAQWVGGAEATGIRDPRGVMAHLNDEVARLATQFGISEGEYLERALRGELPVGAINLGRGAELPVHAVDPVTFAGQLERARGELGPRGFYLTPSTSNELVDASALTFLSKDQGVGYALTREGDLQSLFNVSGVKGSGRAALEHALAQGATSLDAFEGHLTRLYRSYGFEEVKRLPFDERYAPDVWDEAIHGRPDVVYMRQPDVPKEIEAPGIPAPLSNENAVEGALAQSANETLGPLGIE